MPLPAYSAIMGTRKFVYVIAVTALVGDKTRWQTHESSLASTSSRCSAGQRPRLLKVGY